MSNILAKPIPVSSRNARQSGGRWSWLALATTASIGISLLTGFYLYLFAEHNWTVGQVVLAAHIGLGIAALVLLIAWMFEHLALGIGRAKNRLFFWMSWLFLAVFSAVLVTGLIMATPFFLYLGGVVWFYKFETTVVIATVHLVLALALVLSLFAHLLLPHRTRNTKR